MNYQPINKKLIVLDLDETLIHATHQSLLPNINFEYSDYAVYLRPHLHDFFQYLSQKFYIGIWSSADDRYVEDIVKLITPKNIKLEFVWGRSRCSKRKNIELDRYIYEKRLEKLKRLGYNLTQIIIIDDSPEKVKENYGNAIYINPYIGNTDDEELLLLIKYLDTLISVDNVRAVEKRDWKSSVAI